MSSPSSTSTPLAPETVRDEVAGVLSADALEAIAGDTPLLPPREPLGEKLASYFGRHLLLLFWVSFGCFWAILSLPSPFNRPDFAPGDLAPRDYVAPQNAFLPDRAETRRRRAAAAALVTPAYEPAPGAQAQALSLLDENLEKTRAAAARLHVDSKAPQNLVVLPAIRRFEARSGWKPNSQLLPTLRGLSPAAWRAIESAAQEAVRAVYVKARIRSDVGDDLNALRPIMRQDIASNGANLSASERAIALQLAILSARSPNVVVNQRATDEARRDAANAILPVFLRIEANTPLVRQGTRVSGEQFEQLQELGLIAPRFEWQQALAHGSLCLLLVLGAAAYLGRARRDLVLRPSALWLAAVVPGVSLLTFRLFLGVPHADFMMVPLAACAAMLLTVLIDSRVGLPAGFVVAALCALMARAEAGLFLAATLSAWIGALSVTQLSSRFALLRCIALLTVSNAVLAGALGVLREAPLEELLSGAAWSGLAGAASVVAMAGLAIFLERPFGITSHLRLLELLAPDETVIRRMQLEAPGTYTHSMTVAILAEAGAKSVGADPLLCRVAGLYHDIGKLRRPHCFIENQSGDNIHDRLSPGLSALLIKAHVKDGLELGRAVRLPNPVLEIVASHHGTSTIAYFLHRARQNAEVDGSHVDDSQFRYPGPKPRSREAAIVMLADSVEASARTLPQITPEKLEIHVQSLIAARLSEGELDECDLSLREMGLVREAFIAVLRGVLHGRIAYPDTAALSGELASSHDWVRETLGEKSDDNSKNIRNNAKTGQKVAASPQKRQNRERNRVAETNGMSVGNKNSDSGTKTEAKSDSEDRLENPDPAALLRRLKPPFHAPGNGNPSPRPTSESKTSPNGEATASNGLGLNGSATPAIAVSPSSGNQLQLEPESAPLSAGTPANGSHSNSATPQQNGADRDSRDS
jgi:hypothetical protein